MKAKNYSLFFLFIFSIFLITPSVLKIIENDIDISYFFDISEEEKKDKGEEASDPFIVTINRDYEYSNFLFKNQDLFFIENNFYRSIIIDQNYPPPEYISSFIQS